MTQPAGVSQRPREQEHERGDERAPSALVARNELEPGRKEELLTSHGPLISANLNIPVGKALPVSQQNALSTLHWKSPI